MPDLINNVRFSLHTLHFVIYLLHLYDKSAYLVLKVAYSEEKSYSVTLLLNDFQVFFGPKQQMLSTNPTPPLQVGDYSALINFMF